MADLLLSLATQLRLWSAGALFALFMYLKTLFSSTFLLFLLPFLASGQIKPGPSKVVCVINADESPADLAAEAGWKDPNVQGFLIRQSWASLEPTQGTFDFRLFDEAAKLAQENDKFIGLDFGAGSLAPKWIYAAGAESLVSRAAGHPETISVPWNPIFLSAWSSVIEELGNRYDTNPAVAYVVMSGLGRGFDSSLALTPDDAAKFDSLGGQLFWTRAANDIGDLYATSFPHTQVIMPLDAVVPGAKGLKMMATVASEQLDSHPDQFAVDSGSLMADALGSVPAFSNSDQPALASDGIHVSSSEDLQAKLAAAAQSGVLQRASFLEIDSRQAQRGDLRETLDQATSQLATAISTTSTTSTSKIPGGLARNLGLGHGSSASSSGSKTKSTLSAAADAALQVSIKAAALAAAYSGQPIWLSPASTGKAGTGTQSDPLNVPTAEDLESALFYISESQMPNLVFHLLPGTFYTEGNPHTWSVSTGWQFLGAGTDQTTLKIDPSYMTYTSTNKFGDRKVVIMTNGSGGIVVRDMTLDANATGFGCQLAAPFTMPAARGTVSVRVADSSKFTVGKWVYVQDSVATAGVNLFYGLMEVRSIDSPKRITLFNSQVATAGTVTGTTTAGSPVVTGVSSIGNLEQGQTISGPGIPAGTYLQFAADGTATLSANATATTSGATLSYGSFSVPGAGTNFSPKGNVAPGSVIPQTAQLLAACCIDGIEAGRTNDTLENLTIERVGRPFYEGPAGIGLNGYSTCVGTLVQNCTVRDIWGLASWIISLTNNQGVSLIGNSILGNGYSQAYSFVGNNSNCVMTNNSANNCIVGIFSDTGLKTNFKVTGNRFQTISGLDLAGAQFMQSIFSQNSFLVTASYGIGMMLYNVDLTDCTFDYNTIDVAPGLTHDYGVSFNTNCQGSSGNVFSDNIVNSQLTNTPSNPSYGTQNGNVNQNGDAISFGLDE